MLIRDLRDHFEDVVADGQVLFKPISGRLSRLPDIRFDLAGRHFLIGGHRHDLPRHSRRPVHFQICRRAVTLFGDQGATAPQSAPGSPLSRVPPATQKALAAC